MRIACFFRFIAQRFISARTHQAMSKQVAVDRLVLTATINHQRLLLRSPS
jgi:hypothetical protein